MPEKNQPKPRPKPRPEYVKNEAENPGAPKIPTKPQKTKSQGK